MSYSPPPVASSVAPPRAARFAWPLRGVLAVSGLLLLALLLTARRLPPNPAGMGTHRALGLPPCSMVQWFGMRCPACGMTTSWAHLTRGNLPAAVRANSGGTLLGLVAAVAGPWLLASGLRGQWLGQPPHEWLTLGIGLTIIAVTMIDWAVRLTFWR